MKTSENAEREQGSLHQDYVMETVTDILKRLGYSSLEAKNIVKQCWQVETALSEFTAYPEIVQNGGLQRMK